MVRATAAGMMASAVVAASAAAPAPIPVPRPPEAIGQPLGLAQAVQIARADAARRRGVDERTIETISAESVTWRDGGIGCTPPGVMVTMALVPGYRIRLRVQQAVLNYHGSARGALLLCPEELITEPLPDSAR